MGLYKMMMKANAVNLWFWKRKKLNMIVLHEDLTSIDGLYTFESGLGSDDMMEVMKAPPFVCPIGMAGGFRRFGGAGAGRR